MITPPEPVPGEIIARMLTGDNPPRMMPPGMPSQNKAAGARPKAGPQHINNAPTPPAPDGPPAKAFPRNPRITIVQAATVAATAGTIADAGRPFAVNVCECGGSIFDYLPLVLMLILALGFAIKLYFENKDYKQKLKAEAQIKEKRAELDAKAGAQYCANVQQMFCSTCDMNIKDGFLVSHRKTERHIKNVQNEKKKDAERKAAFDMQCTTEIWYVASPGGKCFHIKEDCKAIQPSNVTHAVKGLKPCGYCVKRVM